MTRVTPRKTILTWESGNQLNKIIITKGKKSGLEYVTIIIIAFAL
jgi:hypothetical protein